MSDRDIEELIRQLQAFAHPSSDPLVLPVAPTRVCASERYRPITSPIYGLLDDAHLQTSRRDGSLPHQEAVCLAGLAIIISKCRACPGMPCTLLQTLMPHWPELHRWILYLKSDFVDQEGIELSFRRLVKGSIIRFLSICEDTFLPHIFDPIVASPGIVSTLFSLWHLETQDARFSISGDSLSNRHPSPTFHTQAILDSWMCAFAQRERWDWSEILHSFGGEADALAATALDRLRQDVACTSINYDLVIWDIHLITTLSINEVIRIPLLNQQSMTVVANVINSMVGRYAVTNQRFLVSKCISYGYWYIRAYVESTEGLRWVTQIVEAGLLSAMLSTEPWIKHLHGQDSEDWEPLFLLLGQIIPKYSVYGSVLKPIVKQLTAIDTNGLPGKLNKDSLLSHSWSGFQMIVRNRASLYNSAAGNETHIESCQNAKCDKSGPPGSFKSCAGCLHVHYCSKECQVYDWKNGGHQTYCRDIQLRRAHGLVSRLSKRDVRFIDRVIAQDLTFFRDRIQGSAMMLNLDPVVVELDYTEIPVQVEIGSIHALPAIKACQCDAPVAQKWSHMAELAQKSTSRKILVRAFLPAGTSEKVKLQCLPLKRILGDYTPVTDEEPMSEFDETFDLLYSRAGQSFGIVDEAFPGEAMRAMREKMSAEGKKFDGIH